MKHSHNIVFSVYLAEHISNSFSPYSTWSQERIGKCEGAKTSQKLKESEFEANTKTTQHRIINSKRAC